MAATAKDPVTLGNQYKAEFESTIEGLRQRGTALQATIQEQIANGSSTIEPIKQNIINSVQDQSEIATPPGAVVATFMWTSVLTLAAGISFYLGANILGGAIGLLVGGFGLALLALVAAPAYAYYQLTTAPQGDTESRMLLLAYASIAGLLLGASLSHTYFYAEPLATLTPLTVALVFAYGAPALGNARQTVLGASVGGAAGLTLIVGLFTGSLSISYITLTALYAGAAFVTLQILFQNVKAEDVATHTYMLGYVAAALTAKAVVFTLMGSSTPYAAEESK